jgi:very-short-patch-repair endonuclease
MGYKLSRWVEVLAIVELDDVTHTASDDRKRDAMTSAAGYQTLRYQSQQKPSVSELADTLTKIAATQREKYHA